MAAKIAIRRTLAALLIRELGPFLANCEKAGLNPPKLELKYADGLSQADARDLTEWGMQVPELRQALQSSQHPDHAAVRHYLALANHFQYVHPLKPDGQPADWTEPLSPALRQFVLGETNSVEAKDLAPHEAQDFLTFHETRADQVAAAQDTASPRHTVLRTELDRLAEVALGAPATDIVALPASGKEAAAVPPAPATQARIDEINQALRDPKLNKGTEERQALLTELNSMLSASPPAGGAVPSVSPPPPPAAKTGAARIAELTEALRDPKLPGGSADRQVLLTELNSTLHAPAAPGIGATPA